VQHGPSGYTDGATGLQELQAKLREMGSSVMLVQGPQPQMRFTCAYSASQARCKMTHRPHRARPSCGGRSPSRSTCPHSLRCVQYADPVYGYCTAQVQGILSQSSGALPTICHTPVQVAASLEMQKTGGAPAEVQLPTQLDKCAMCRSELEPGHGVGVCRSSTPGTSCSCTCIQTGRRMVRKRWGLLLPGG